MLQYLLSPDTVIGFIPDTVQTHSSWLEAGKTEVDHIDRENHTKVVLKDVTDEIPLQK